MDLLFEGLTDELKDKLTLEEIEGLLLAEGDTEADNDSERL
jgi:hypothetical protein